MCLAVPGRVLELIGDDPLARSARVDFGGLIRRINLAFVPEARVGDHVLVHVGVALAVIDEDEAARIFRWLGEIEAPQDSGGERQ